MVVVKGTRGNPRGPRFLTQRNLEKVVLKVNGDETPRPPIGPGEMQLFSYYRPGLTAGTYSIFTEQRIEAPGEKPKRAFNHLENNPEQYRPQEFEVMTPQFNLEPSLVNSYYPPDGHQDEARILPHIVLNDPHFPWERDVSNDPDSGLAGPIDDDVIDGKTVSRNLVPWVKLLVFDTDELKIDANDDIAKSIKGFDAEQQPADGAFPMTSGDFFKIPRDARIDFDAAYANDDETLTSISTGRLSKQATRVIFPEKKLFYSLCKDIESNKYLAHVRNINTVGFPNAGVEEDGIFSVVISGRIGSREFDPPDQPKTQICHLISLEHADRTLTTDFADSNDRIGLISLYSWTYTVLPPNPVNFIDSIEDIIQLFDGTNPKQTSYMQMLKPPQRMIDAMATAVETVETKDGDAEPDVKSRAKKALVDRFNRGYTISRWRAETGEVTAAFNRGPLVPAPTPIVPSSDWPAISNTSKNLQILDTETGLMDLSYSAAWQLGKILAISDTTFNEALVRFRSFIQKKAESVARSKVNRVASRRKIIDNVNNEVKVIGSLLDDDVDAPRRVISPPERRIVTNLDDPIMVTAMDEAVYEAVASAGSAGDEIYSEFNLEGVNNTDWSIIHTWITDKLYLGGIPAHVLFPDPSYIPEESLRYFFIDDAWMDCLIDGALSVGNHLERDDDLIKSTIKRFYNEYLSTVIPGTENLKPQIPHYGFILRSEIVKVMPDMRINIRWNNSPTNDSSDQSNEGSQDAEDLRAPVCQWLRPDDHTVICLLDRPPEELAPRPLPEPEEHEEPQEPEEPEELSNNVDLFQSGIVLSQPPHQQRFAFGSEYDDATKEFRFHVRRLYTDEKELPVSKWGVGKDLDQPSQYIGPSGELDMCKLAHHVNEILQQLSPAEPGNKHVYTDTVPNSAEIGLILNDPARYFAIYPPSDGASSNIVPRLRQLWTGEKESPVKGKPLLAKSSSVLAPASKAAPPPRQCASRGPPRAVPRDAPHRNTRVVVRNEPAVHVDSVARLIGPIQQCFTLQVYAYSKGITPAPSNTTGFAKDAYIPTRNKYLHDLIFCLRKASNVTQGNTQLLREIVISIPHVADTNNPISSRRTGALVTPGWDGNVRILSNQRFTPFVSRTETRLLVRLVPRSAKDHPEIRMNDLKTTEVSFRMSEVEVPENDHTGFVTIDGERKRMGIVKLDVFERYGTDGDAVQSVSSQTTVLKSDEEF